MKFPRFFLFLFIFLVLTISLVPTTLAKKPSEQYIPDPNITFNIADTYSTRTGVVDSSVYSEFQKHCEENAIMLSKKVEIFMRGFLDEEKKKGDTQKGINEK